MVFAKFSPRLEIVETTPILLRKSLALTAVVWADAIFIPDEAIAIGVNKKILSMLIQVLLQIYFLMVKAPGDRAICPLLST
jgi:hypothetical protein